MHLISVTSAVPADGWDDIRKFLPGAPNLVPFTGLAGVISALGALILGAIIVISIVLAFWNAFKWLTASGNPHKANEAKGGLKTALIWLLCAGVLWGTLVAFIIRAGQSVT